MNKYFTRGLLVTFVLAIVFIFGAVVFATPASAVTSATLCKTVESLISAGAIEADQADAARTGAGCPKPAVPQICSTIELLINMGVVKPERAAAARLAFGCPTGTIPVTPIENPTLGISSPANGTVWQKDSTQNIIWQILVSCPSGSSCMPPPPESFDIYLEKYNTGSVQKIASNVEGFVYPWRISDSTGGLGTYYTPGNYKIKICGVRSNLCGKSYSYFTISSSEPVQYIPVINMIGTPTLSLTYDDQQKESQLRAVFNFSITAGDQPVNIYKNANGTEFTDGEHYVNSPTDISPVNSMSLGSDIYHQPYYTVPAGTSVTFIASSLAKPSTMFAGSYKAIFNGVTAVYGYTGTDAFKVSPVEGVATPSVLIIGETSPYINSAVASSTANGVIVVLSGSRLENSKNVVIVNSPRDVWEIANAVNGTGMHFMIKAVAGNYSVQVEDSVTGKSNIVGFTVPSGSVPNGLTYTVTYSNNNGVGTSPVEPRHYPGDIVTVQSPTNLTRAGYVFSGWNTLPTGTGVDYAPGSTFEMGSARVILYARWTASARACTVFTYSAWTACIEDTGTNSMIRGSSYTGTRTRTVLTQAPANCVGGMPIVSQSCNVIPSATYSVTYNKNGALGGAVPVDANKYELGGPVVVLDNIGNLTKTGYTFSGWNTLPTGVGIDRDPGLTFEIGSNNVILYARWTANARACTVFTYSAWSACAQNVEDGSGRGDFSGTRTRTVLTQAPANCVGGNPILSQSCTIPSAITYTVTYLNNGGVGTAPKEPSHVLGDIVTVQDSNGLTKAGYVFAGWNTLPTGTGVDYAPGSTFEMGSARVILYARWTASARTCTTFTYTPFSACVDGNQTRSVLTQLPANCVNGAPILSRTCTAVTYPVTYLNNGGVGTAPKEPSHALGDIVTVQGPNNLTRVGYVFAGWNTLPTGLGIDRPVGSTFIMGSTRVILYARWIKAPVSVGDEQNYSAPAASFEAILRLIEALR